MERKVMGKVQKLRVELQNLKLKKSGENKFAGFEYYELADFLPKVNELEEKNKLFSCFKISSKEADKEPIASLTITDIETGEEIVFTSPIAEANVKGCTPIQSLGAIHTYMKRYLYMNAYEIVENDMLDSVVGKNDAKATEKQIALITELVDDIPALLKYYEISRIEDLSIKQASEIISKKKGK